MIDLPRPLAPWAPQLRLFPEPMALALGAIVLRLSPLLGAGEDAAARAGTPAGYDGISRRGSYEQLLPSEWLLLEEVPDEFLRRALAGEQAFLRRAFTQGAAGKRCIALFDTGVDQLGAPRIAQLALWVLLVRRAQLQGAALEWGVFQDAKLELQSGVTRAAVYGLLRARCERRVSAADIQRWTGLLSGLGGSESWLIGSEVIAPPAAAALRGAAITIEDIIEPGPSRRVRVRAWSSPSARPKQAVLELPAERVAVQLLRDPFPGAAAPPRATLTALDPQSTLAFSPDGRRVFARGTDGTLVGVHVPNSPRAKPAPASLLRAPQGHRILGVGAWRKRSVALSQRGAELFLHVLSRRGTSIFSSERFRPREGYALTELSLTTLRPLGVLAADRACCIDDGGNLIELAQGDITVVHEARAIAARSVRDFFVWAALRGASPRVYWVMTATAGKMAIRSASLPSHLPRLYDTHELLFGSGVSELFAYRAAPLDWVVVHKQEWFQCAVAPDFTVVGVVEGAGEQHRAGLVALDASKRRLALFTRDHWETLVTASAPVTRVAVSGSGTLVAFITAVGELGIYSCLSNNVTLRTLANVGNG